MGTAAGKPDVPDVRKCHAATRADARWKLDERYFNPERRVDDVTVVQQTTAAGSEHVSNVDGSTTAHAQQWFSGGTAGRPPEGTPAHRRTSDAITRQERERQDLVHVLTGKQFPKTHDPSEPEYNRV